LCWTEFLIYLRVPNLVRSLSYEAPHYALFSIVLTLRLFLTSRPLLNTVCSKHCQRHCLADYYNQLALQQVPHVLWTSDTYQILIGSARSSCEWPISINFYASSSRTRPLLCPRLCTKTHRPKTAAAQIQNKLSHCSITAQLYWCCKISRNDSAVKQHTALHIALYYTSRLHTLWPLLYPPSLPVAYVNQATRNLKMRLSLPAFL
jgi:hypothetical protein